jgi:acyl-CoA thioesterase FadM
MTIIMKVVQKKKKMMMMKTKTTTMKLTVVIQAIKQEIVYKPIICQLTLVTVQQAVNRLKESQIQSQLRTLKKDYEQKMSDSAATVVCVRRRRFRHCSYPADISSLVKNVLNLWIVAYSVMLQYWGLLEPIWVELLQNLILYNIMLYNVELTFFQLVLLKNVKHFFKRLKLKTLNFSSIKRVAIVCVSIYLNMNSLKPFVESFSNFTASIL